MRIIWSGSKLIPTNRIVTSSGHRPSSVSRWPVRRLTQLVRSRARQSPGQSPRERRGSTRWCCARRNFIPNDAYPYTTPVALTYDSGDYFKTLDMAVKAADYASFEQRRKGATKRGKLRGIGISTYIEACAMAPSVIAGQLGARAGFYESAEVRAHPTGSITVFTGSHSHGQGHETTFAQLVADRFGVPLEMVEIVQHRPGPLRHGDLRVTLACGGRYRTGQGHG